MAHEVLIVGGGIGGLALGAALRQRQIGYRILERTADIKTVGAGIAVGNNMLAVLRALGCAGALERRAHPIGARVFQDARGRTLRRVSLAGTAGGIGAHRAILFDALFDAAGAEQIALGTTLRSFTTSTTGVDVESSDGRRARYDLLVGADGVHSELRSRLFPAATPRYAGYVAMRFIVPRPASTADDAIHMTGPGRQLGFIPLDRERLYCYPSFTARKDPPPPPAEDRAGVLRAAFAGFGGRAPEILARLDATTQVLHNRIEEVRLQTWGSGRAVLLGDAAHAMCPDLAQGGAMAVEDAYVLASCLASERSVGDAVARYQSERIPRVRGVQASARRLGWLGSVEAPLLVMLRDLALRFSPMELGPPPPLEGLERAA